MYLLVLALLRLLVLGARNMRSRSHHRLIDRRCQGEAVAGLARVHVFLWHEMSLTQRTDASGTSQIYYLSKAFVADR